MKNPNLELKRARAKGKKIVEDAKIKALSIIANAYGEEIQKIASDVALQFKNEALLEIARFKTELEEKIVTIEGVAEKVLSEEYDEIKAEIQKYKESKIAQIDATAKEIITDVSKKVLSKAIDLRAHSDLVIKSLEDAKRENLF